MTENKNATAIIRGAPTERQKEFFSARSKYVAYGGARGGGKSWALRRKLTAMCLRYGGLHCLLVRRSLFELKSNHVFPFLREYGSLVSFSSSDMCLYFKNGSRIDLGYCDSDRDALRYQGQEYDIIAIDEATQLSEYRFSIFKACLRGANSFPHRMYLTCNPGGIGHSWVKRLFIDRKYREGELADDYTFIPALVYDNTALIERDPEYVKTLESLPPKMRDAWLYGKWDIFEGQFFPEFDPALHVYKSSDTPCNLKYFISVDYGFDMLAALLLGIDRAGNVFVLKECCKSGLTLSEAARRIVDLCKYRRIEFVTASPDLWNRRQDSGRSGFEIMQAVAGMPPMRPADDRRIAGWRLVREYLASSEGSPRLRINENCSELIRSLPALLYDKERTEDASSEPHDVTHAPEALRYGLMSRIPPPELIEKTDFHFGKKTSPLFFD
ncbi:MAG: terminase family protein [Clostridia bacterium]|nr:terminase family protein [Clostridia bacterium]